MACLIHLTPLNAGTPPNGRWFLIGAPAGFAGNLSVSCTGSPPWVLNTGLPSNSNPLDASCANKYDIWVGTSVMVTGTYTFAFVSPDTENAFSCIVAPGEEPAGCDACSFFEIEVIQNTSDNPIQEICEATGTYNLYQLAGLNCADYSLDYQAGSPQDADFETSWNNSCPTKGDFNSALITPAKYYFEFVRNDALPDCDTCTIVLELTISDLPFTGYSQTDSYCLI